MWSGESGEPFGYVRGWELSYTICRRTLIDRRRLMAELMAGLATDKGM
jgi:hypothetical protein